ncbi:hypothetical protein EYF80_067430 [Liparis tanakae]|uniref:Uncharacterized protein n=1 Tax=Liparis tanakae TaxID=230148 RepID=A0A4Z2E0V4_9TELE|nr:hypothetical protein EYF80_067430 [Liparis tanakae]
MELRMQTCDPLIQLKASGAPDADLPLELLLHRVAWFPTVAVRPGDGSWQLVGPLGQTATPSRPMHTASVRQHAIIITEEVQIAEVSEECGPEAICHMSRPAP